MSIRCAGVLALVDTEGGRVVAVREDCEHEKMWKALRGHLAERRPGCGWGDSYRDGLRDGYTAALDLMDELEREEAACAKCGGRGWHPESIAPDHEDYLERYCNCAAGRRRALQEGGTVLP